MVTQSVLYGLLAAAIVGAAVFTMALVTRRVALSQVVFWSHIGSVGVATLYLVVASDLSLLSLDQWVQIVIMSAMGLAGYIAYLRALKTGPVAIAAPIVSGEGAVVILLAVVFSAERLTLGQSLGASAAVVGVVLASVDLRRLSGGQRLIGKGAAFAAFTMLVFGVNLYVLARISQDVGWFLPLYAYNLVKLGVIVPAAAVRRELPWRGLTLGLVLLVMIVGVLEVGGFFVFYRGTEVGTIAIVTAATTVYPLVPIVGGVLMFRERLSPNQMIGIVSVLGGLLLLSLG